MIRPRIQIWDEAATPFRRLLELAHYGQLGPPSEGAHLGAGRSYIIIQDRMDVTDLPG